MNSTMTYWKHAWTARRMTSRAAIGRAVQSAVSEPPPPEGQPFAAEQALIAACTAPSACPPYYISQTVAAMLSAVACALAAWLVYGFSDASGWAAPAAIGLAAGALASGYAAVAKSFGPTVITADRLDQAIERLDESGDRAQMPMGLGTAALMVAALLVDGVLAGYTLSSEALASILTPRAAMVGSAVWSVAVTILLWDLVQNAAQEGAINARRGQLRQLMRSNDPQDQERAHKMLQHVGGALGHDLSLSANRSRARWLLAVVILLLSVTTFVMRVMGETKPDEVSGAGEAPVAEEPAR